MSTQNKSETTDHMDDKVATSHSSMEINVDQNKPKRSVSDLVFAGVFVPVYATGSFFWWVAHGCPDP
jgi:hypothetical protein